MKLSDQLQLFINSARRDEFKTMDAQKEEFKVLDEFSEVNPTQLYEQRHCSTNTKLPKLAEKPRSTSQSSSS